MVSMIVGEQGLAGVLNDTLSQVPNLKTSSWQAPNGVLTSLRAPANGLILLAATGVSVPRLLSLGWRVVWVGVGEMPAGCEPVPADWLTLSVGSLISKLWNVPTNDGRLVGDVLAGDLSRLGLPIVLAGEQAGVLTLTLGLRLTSLHKRVSVVDCSGDLFDMVGGQSVSTTGNWVDVRSVVVPGLGVNLPFLGVQATDSDEQTLDRIVRQLARHVDVVLILNPPVSVASTWGGGLHAPLVYGGRVSRLGLTRARRLFTQTVNSFTRIGVYWIVGGRKLSARVPTRLPAPVTLLTTWTLDGKTVESLDLLPVQQLSTLKPVHQLTQHVTDWLGYTTSARKPVAPRKQRTRK